VRGSDLPRFNSKGRQIPVRLRLGEEDRAQLDDLNNMLVPTEDGRFSSIGTITRPTMLKSEEYIRRTNRKLSYTFGMKLKQGQEKTAKANISNATQNIDLPEGVSFGEIRKSFDDKDQENGEFVVYIAILFIYMLIAFLFESMLLPLSIILTIPLAAMGSIWIHYLTQTSMDRMGLVGAILLVGIVVNNGIVLVNYANQLRQSGMERTAAMLEASRVRFRPVFMTAMTTICGMIPLTFSSSNEMGVNYQSFGYTLIGGMTCATLFTLLAVPVFYTLIDDAQIALRNTLATVFDHRTTQKLTSK
jgi:HAE1 family hydrophobic/amphiphilic exporter-1